MKNGKKLEKLVRLIQETLKDFPKTEIFSNYKIQNRSGRKREFDVLLRTTVNNYDFLIVIECKDYKTAVSVEKIEAFNSKCQRVKGISKKVFVAANGYQADAIDAAKDFDIELYHLNEIDKHKVIEWFPIKQLKGRYLLKQPYEILIDCPDKDFAPEGEDELIVYFYDNSDPILLTGLLWNKVVFEKQRYFKSILIYDFLKYNNFDYQTIFPFKIDLSGVYLKGKKEKKIDILSVKSSVIGWLEEIPATIIEARSYNSPNCKTIANIVTIDINKNEVADIVFTEDKELKIFHTESNGHVNQMETLFEYNPKTDEFIDLRKKS
jgi:hypothetical protein